MAPRGDQTFTERTLHYLVADPDTFLELSNDLDKKKWALETLIMGIDIVVSKKTVQKMQYGKPLEGST